MCETRQREGCGPKHFYAVIVVALLVTGTLTAQNNSATFTSSTELVLIPTVVNDKSGAHISGLAKNDCALKQDGKDFPIACVGQSHGKRGRAGHGAIKLSRNSATL